MSEHPWPEQEDSLEGLVVRAQAGDRPALEAVIRAVQGNVYGLALRFLWHPQDAEDASQEILVRILTGLGSFRGESRFRTWAYRVACNTLLTLRKQRMERRALSFEQMGEDLARGLSDAPLSVEPEVDHALLLEEVKIGCTLAIRGLGPRRTVPAAVRVVTGACPGLPRGGGRDSTTRGGPPGRGALSLASGGAAGCVVQHLAAPSARPPARDRSRVNSPRLCLSPGDLFQLRL
jgi:RNA polymerase sigma factor (sigma-70 family)